MQVDQSLINKCLKGNENAYFVLYNLCFSHLMTVCLRYYKCREEASPVLNKAFLKITQNLDKYSLEKPFVPWAKRIMINTIINEYKSNKSRKALFVPTDFNSENADFDTYSFNEVLSQIELNYIKSLIHELPDIQKQVFNLYVIDGYVHKEIAEMLDVPIGTSKWLLAEARKKLKARILKSMTTKGMNAI